MEIERKYLLKELPDLGNFEHHKIEQAYLCTGPVVRVRREDENYYMTYKGSGMMSREEYNLALTKAKPGYNPKGGRPAKYTDDDRAKCIALHESGMSYRKIAQQFGIPLSAVQRMLAG